MADAAVIEQMKKWALDNYEKGADTFVECWGTSDYVHLIDVTCEGQLDGEDGAWAILKSMASIYADQQADARYYRMNA